MSLQRRQRARGRDQPSLGIRDARIQPIDRASDPRDLAFRVGQPGLQLGDVDSQRLVGGNHGLAQLAQIGRRSTGRRAADRHPVHKQVCRRQIQPNAVDVTRPSRGERDEPLVPRPDWLGDSNLPSGVPGFADTGPP